MAKYGFFSKDAQKDGCNVAVWKNKQGDEIKVTCVCPDLGGKSYKAIDKQFVGEVTEFVRVEQIHPEFARCFDLTI